jgi:hypothetical protein
LSGKILFFLCWYHNNYFFSPAMISIEILLWCKASYVWSFNNFPFGTILCYIFFYMCRPVISSCFSKSWQKEINMETIVKMVKRISVALSPWVLRFCNTWHVRGSPMYIYYFSIFKPQ